MERPPSDVEFGLLEETDAVARSVGVTAEVAFEDWSSDELRPRELSRYVTAITKQIGSMCTAHATCNGHGVQASIQGLPYVPLAPHQLYGRCGSTFSGGSTLPANLREIREHGVMPLDALPNQRDWQPRHWPRNWKSLAEPYRVDEFIDLGGRIDFIQQALSRGMPVVLGVDWPGGGGHAVLATDQTVGRGGWLRGPNSWGREWNGDGFWQFDLDNRRLWRSCEKYGAWAVCSVVHYVG